MAAEALPLARTAGELLARLRQQRPLIHYITNLVVTNFTANATLAMGAAPVMAHAPEEVAEMARAARALVLNIGTLDERQVASMLLAGQAANAAGVPVVLDPVGAGATRLRTETALRLLTELRVAVLRGNAGELGVLAGLGGEVSGVDAGSAGAGGQAVAEACARRFGGIAVATGAVDYASDGRRTLAVHNGHPWLTLVTGTGCVVTGVVAAFVAVADDPLLGAAGALAYYGLAAERAAARSQGPGSFQVAFLDELHRLAPQEVEAGARMAWVDVASA